MRSCNFSNIHFCKLLQNRFLFLTVGLSVVAMACNQKGDNRPGKATRGDNETGAHWLDTMLLSTPNTGEINPDSLTRLERKGRIVKAGKPEVIEYEGVVLLTEIGCGTKGCQGFGNSLLPPPKPNGIYMRIAYKMYHFHLPVPPAPDECRH